MKYPAIGHRLPDFLTSPLFGNRKRFGLSIKSDDACWQEWTKTYLTFYDTTQKQSSIGSWVNNAGYQIMSSIPLEGLKILEIGPGDLNHIDVWWGKPESFSMVDVQTAMLDRAAMKLSRAGVKYSAVHINPDTYEQLPFDENEFDMVLSFYSLEHLHPITTYLYDMLRVLKPKGKLVGAIPCEGGLAWGAGRFLTSRRWLLKHTNIDPDKIICWEHPNFADHILETMDRYMLQVKLAFWPMNLPCVDLNLVAKFIYEKR